jgi:hypothetical protein
VRKLFRALLFVAIFAVFVALLLRLLLNSSSQPPMPSSLGPSTASPASDDDQPIHFK